MEQESFKTPIAISCKRCFPWERIRSLLCFALVICLLTCMAFQFIFLVSMHRQLEQVQIQLRENTKMRSQWERRLTISENETKAISQLMNVNLGNSLESGNCAGEGESNKTTAYTLDNLFTNWATSTGPEGNEQAIMGILNPFWHHWTYASTKRVTRRWL